MVRKLRPEHAVIIALITCFAVLLFAVNSSITLEQQFVYQAESFLHGRMDLMDKPGTWSDVAIVEDRYYWPLGPFPSIPLMPFVAVFGYDMLQGYLQILLTVFVFILTYQLARRRTFSAMNSAWFAVAFICGSIFLGVALMPWSWYYAQVVTTVLLLAALLEHSTRRRWWLIGILMACVMATRMGAVFTVLFFILAIAFENVDWRKKLSALTQLVTPLFAVGVLLTWMNVARFGSWSSNGYWLQDVKGPNNLNRDLYGLFSVKNVLPNIFNYFFRIPHVFPPTNYDAMLQYPGIFPGSFFVVSPFFAWAARAFSKKVRETRSWLLLIGSLPTVVSLMFYYAGGQRLGPRYLVDVLPLWYMLLLIAFKNTPLRWYHKMLIGVSAVANLVIGFSVFYS